MAERSVGSKAGRDDYQYPGPPPLSGPGPRPGPPADGDAAQQRSFPQPPISWPAPAPPVSEFVSNVPVNPWTGQVYTTRYFDILEGRKQLPVWENKQVVVDTVRANQVTLLVGETGSGKSTQLPQFLAEAFGSGPSGPSDAAGMRVVCTQPRRVAALSVAQRVAEEMDVPVGSTVGYAVRFDECRSPASRIVFVTDGILLREAMRDPLLSEYKVLVIDEAHERSVATDLLLGLVQLRLLQRPDLRVVIMSATLDVGKFRGVFPEAPTVRVPGRMHDVSLFYTSAKVADYVATSVAFAWRAHCEEPFPGDILVFLSGEREIENACRLLRRRVSEEGMDGHEDGPCKGIDASVRALYGALAMDEQRKVFDPAPEKTRRIFFATNIAETSLTIDGVVVVIDSGYCKQHTYLPDTHTDCLARSVVSKAAAEQRKGRAGRTRPGKCFRLFPESDWSLLPDQTYPELQRTSLTDVCLTILRLGVTNLLDFPFIDAPAAATLGDALTQLSFFGAIDDDMNVTETGAKLGAFPVEPAAARMLLHGCSLGCGADVAIIAAMLSTSNVFSRPQALAQQADAARAQFTNSFGDHMTLFNAYNAYANAGFSAGFCRESFLNVRAMDQARRVVSQLTATMERLGLPVVSSIPLVAAPRDAASGAPAWRRVNVPLILRSVTAGYFVKSAFLPAHAVRAGSAEYVLVREGTPCAMHLSSVFSGGRTGVAPPRWVVFDRFESTAPGERPSMRTVSRVADPTWLLEASDDYFSPDDLEVAEVAKEMRQVVAARDRLAQHEAEAAEQRARAALRDSSFA